MSASFSRSGDLWSRAVLGTLQFAAIAWFSPGRGLPLDDAWIHQDVARTFAETGTLGYVPGEHGAAATSYLWAALLAIDFKIVHVDPSRWALFLNVASALAAGQLLHALVDRARPDDAGEIEWRGASLLTTLLACISPNVLWFVCSGMEAMPFVALSLAAIWAATGGGARRALGAGIASGALALLRPEAVPLGGLLSAYVLVRARRDTAGTTARAVRVAAPWAALVAIYVGSNLAKTGHALPSTLAGRRWLWFAMSGGDTSFDRALDFVDAWGTRLGTYTLDTSLAFVWVLIALAAYGALSLAKSRDPERDGLKLVFAWALAHAAFYALLLPTPGHGGRYQPLTPLLFALCLPLGAAFVLRDLVRVVVSPHARGYGWFVAAAVGAFGALGAPVADSLRQANALAVAHIQATEIEAGAFVGTLPEGAVASFDIGGIGWATRRRILDLGGLSDPATAALLKAGKISTWLESNRVRWVVLPQSTEPTLPVFDDYRSRLNLRANPALRMKALRAFSTPPDKWSPAIRATWNASQSQVVYEVEYTGDPQSAERTLAAAPAAARRPIADSAGLVHERERHFAESLLATLAASGLVADIRLAPERPAILGGHEGAPQAGCELTLGWWGVAVDGCASLDGDALRPMASEAVGRYIDSGDLGGALAALPHVLAAAQRRVDPGFLPPLAPLHFPTPGGNGPPPTGASGSGSAIFLAVLVACAATAGLARRRPLVVRVAERVAGLARTALQPPAARIVVFFAVLAGLTRLVVGSERGSELARAVFKGPGAVEIALERDKKRDPSRLVGPLFDASTMGDTDSVSLLLERGARADPHGPDGSMPLHVAARHGHHAVVALLASAMAPASLLDAQAGPRQRTALHDAVATGSVGTVSALLRAGASPDSVDLFAETPLHLLATADPAKASAIATRLLAHGADPRAMDVRGFTALHAAAAADNVELIQALTEARPDLVDVPTPAGETAVDVALRYARDRAAEALLLHRSTIRGPDVWPPLHDAARMDALDRAANLVAVSANTERLFHGKTALEVAHDYGSKRVEALLRGADRERAQ
jgi:ankyrin repeat protein